VSAAARSDCCRCAAVLADTSIVEVVGGPLRYEAYIGVDVPPAVVDLGYVHRPMMRPLRT
jgi:hypothetical protein